MHDQHTRYRLKIPIEDALSFAMGESDLDSRKVTEAMRQLVGFFLIDALEYAEHWRIAAEVRALLADRWPGCPCFEIDRNPG